MKIEVKTKAPFSSIEIGDTFEFEGNFFIKTDNVEDVNTGCIIQALCLDNGVHARFYDNDIVTPFNLKVVKDV